MPTQFPNPSQPYSLQEIIQRILSDCDYAQFIHDKVIQARAGDADAKAIVDANFQPQATELDALGISAQEQSAYGLCTDTKTGLIAVAAYVQTGH